jgi:hypothetical protein
VSVSNPLKETRRLRVQLGDALGYFLGFLRQPRLTARRRHSILLSHTLYVP